MMMFRTHPVGVIVKASLANGASLMTALNKQNQMHFQEFRPGMWHEGLLIRVGSYRQASERMNVGFHRYRLEDINNMFERMAFRVISSQTASGVANVFRSDTGSPQEGRYSLTSHISLQTSLPAMMVQPVLPVLQFVCLMRSPVLSGTFTISCCRMRSRFVSSLRTFLRGAWQTSTFACWRKRSSNEYRYFPLPDDQYWLAILRRAA